MEILKSNNLVDREEPKFQARYNWTKEQQKEFTKKYFLKVSKKSGLMSGFIGTYNYLKSQGHQFIVITARGLTSDGTFMKEMEESNIKNIRNIVGKDKENKIYRLLDFSNNPRNIADPWYTGNFEATYNDIAEGCTNFLLYLNTKNNSHNGILGHFCNLIILLWYLYKLYPHATNKNSNWTFSNPFRINLL